MKRTIITTAVIITLLSVVSGQKDGGLSDGAGLSPDGGAGLSPDGGAGLSPDGGAGLSPDGGAGLSPDGGAGLSPDGGAGLSPDESEGFGVGSKFCPKLVEPENGEIIRSFPLPTIAKYFCDVGYVLVGDDTRCCVRDVFSGRLVWRRKYPPTCVPECDYLKDPDGGCVVTTGNKPGDKAFYFCDDGFTLDGEKKRKCEDGKWDGKKPTCLKKCPKLPHIPYGRVYTDGLKPGSTATYHCEHGYSLNSYKKRICDNYGTWTYGEPTCDRSSETSGSGSSSTSGSGSSSTSGSGSSSSSGSGSSSSSGSGSSSTSGSGSLGSQRKSHKHG